MSTRICERKKRVDDRVPYFGVRRSPSLANEIGIEHRTKSIQAWIRLNEIFQNFEDHIEDL